MRRWLARLLLLGACVTTGGSILGARASRAPFPAGGITTLQMVTASTGWGWGDQLVVRTTDGGNRLVAVTPRDLGGLVYQGAVLDSTHAWILAKTSRTGFSRVFRTGDGGKHWSRALMPGSLDQLTFIDARHGWAEYTISVANHAAQRVTLLRTVDGGAHWAAVYHTTARIPIEPNVQKGGCQWSLPRFSSPLHGIVGLTCDRTGRLLIEITDDGGRTWRRSQLPPMPHGPGTALFTSVQRPFMSGRHVVTFVILCLGNGQGCAEWGRLYRSDDGGRTWSVGTSVVRAGLGMVQAGLNDIWLPYACLGNCGGTPDLLWTRDAGAHWTSLSLPRRLEPNMHGDTQFQFVTPSVGFAVEAQEFDPRAHFYRTSDGGRTFREFVPRLVSSS